MGSVVVFGCGTTTTTTTTNKSLTNARWASYVHDEAPTAAPGTIQDEQALWAIDGAPARDSPTHLGCIFTECRSSRPPDSRQDLLVPSTQHCCLYPFRLALLGTYPFPIQTSRCLGAMNISVTSSPLWLGWIIK